MSEQNPIKPEILQDYVATANSGKYSGWEEINSKFPELEGVDPQVLQDYVATANSGKYSGWEDINSKFPELFGNGVEKKSPVPSVSTSAQESGLSATAGAADAQRKIPSVNEQRFRSWWETNPAIREWKAQESDRTGGRPPSPDGGNYDYRTAFNRGLLPTRSKDASGNLMWEWPTISTTRGKSHLSEGPESPRSAPQKSVDIIQETINEEEKASAKSEALAESRANLDALEKQAEEAKQSMDKVKDAYMGRTTPETIRASEQYEAVMSDLLPKIESARFDYYRRNGQKGLSVGRMETYAKAILKLVSDWGISLSREAPAIITKGAIDLINEAMGGEPYPDMGSAEGEVIGRLHRAQGLYYSPYAMFSEASEARAYLEDNLMENPVYQQDMGYKLTVGAADLGIQIGIGALTGPVVSTGLTALRGGAGEFMLAQELVNSTKSMSFNDWAATYGNQYPEASPEALKYQYERLKETDADDAAMMMFGMGAAIYTSEGLPVTKWINKVSRIGGKTQVGKRMRQWLEEGATARAQRLGGRFESIIAAAEGDPIASAALGGMAEAMQEGLSNMAVNATAKEIYDTNRMLLDGVAESALLGGTLGVTADLMLSTVETRLQRGNLNNVDRMYLEKTRDDVNRAMAQLQTKGRAYLTDMQLKTDHLTTLREKYKASVDAAMTEGIDPELRQALSEEAHKAHAEYIKAEEEIRTQLSKAEGHKAALGELEKLRETIAGHDTDALMSKVTEGLDMSDPTITRTMAERDASIKAQRDKLLSTIDAEIEYNKNEADRYTRDANRTTPLRTDPLTLLDTEPAFSDATDKAARNESMNEKEIDAAIDAGFRLLDRMYWDPRFNGEDTHVLSSLIVDAIETLDNYEHQTTSETRKTFAPRRPRIFSSTRPSARQRTAEQLWRGDGNPVSYRDNEGGGADGQLVIRTDSHGNNYAVVSFMTPNNGGGELMVGDMNKLKDKDISVNMDGDRPASVTLALDGGKQITILNEDLAADILLEQQKAMEVPQDLFDELIKTFEEGANSFDGKPIELVQTGTETVEVKKPRIGVRSRATKAPAEVVSNMNATPDATHITRSVGSLEEVPPQFRERATKVTGGTTISQKHFMGIPYGKETTNVNERWEYTVTAAEEKAAIAANNARATGDDTALRKIFSDAFKVADETRMEPLLKKLQRAFPGVKMEVMTNAEITARFGPGVKGAYHDGRVYLNKDLMTFDTPIHEMGHVWLAWAKDHAPQLWRKGMDLVSGTPYETAAKMNRPELTGEDLLDEALAQLIGDNGAAVMGTPQEKTIVEWARTLWDAIAKYIKSGSTGPDIQALNLKEFVDLATGMVIGGKKIYGKDLSGNVAKKQVTLKHGSGKLFDAFDSSKAGTGNGGAIFGHGTYFTVDDNSAKTFAIAEGAKQLNQKSYNDIINQAESLTRDSDTRDILLSLIDNAIFGSPVLDYGDSFRSQKAHQLFSKVKSAAESLRPERYLYTATIKDEANNTDTWLNWDAPITATQAERIVNQAKAEGINIQRTGNEIIINDKTISRGADIYNALTSAINKDQKATSEFLTRAGFVGNTYLRYESTRGGAGSPNYVVFKDSSIKIEQTTKFQKMQRNHAMERAIAGARAAGFTDDMIIDHLKSLGYTEGDYRYMFRSSLSPVRPAGDLPFSAEQFMSTASSDRIAQVLAQNSADVANARFKNSSTSWLKLRESLTDRQARIKDYLTELSEDLALANIVNMGGSGGAASVYMDRHRRRIFNGLSIKEREELNQVIALRRLHHIYKSTRERGEQAEIALTSAKAQLAAAPTDKTLQQLVKDLTDRRDKYQQRTKDYMTFGTVQGVVFDETSIQDHLLDREINSPALMAKLNDRANKYFEAHKEILDMYADNGLISKEVYDALKNYDYSPTEYMELELHKQFQEEHRGTGTGTDPIQEIGTGATFNMLVDAEGLLESKAKSTFKMLFRNRASQELGKVAAKISSDNAALPTSEQNRMLMPATVHSTDRFGNKTYSPPPVGYTAISYRVDGKTEVIWMENEMAESYKGLPPFMSPAFAEGLSWITGTKVYKMMVTAANPLFAPFNFARDFATVTLLTNNYSNWLPVAAWQLSSDLFTVFGQYAKAVIKNPSRASIMRGLRESDMFVEAAQDGLLMKWLSTQGALSGSNVTSAIHNALRPLNKVRSWLGMNPLSLHPAAEHKIADNIEAFSSALGHLGEMSEVYMRLAVRERRIKHHTNQLTNQHLARTGIAPTATEQQQIHRTARQLATADARNLIDFGQGGTLTKAIDGVFPYMNASIQGTAVAYKNIGRNPAGFTLKLLQASTAFAGLVAYNVAAGGEDEEGRPEYLNIDPDIRMRHWVFMDPFGRTNEKGEKLYYKLPKPHEAIPFLAAAETFVDQWNFPEHFEEGALSESAGAFAKGMRSSMPGHFLSNLPPVLNASIAYFANYDMFLDRKIYKGFTNEGQHFEEITPNTHEFFKWLGRTTAEHETIGPVDIPMTGGISPARAQAAATKLLGPLENNPLTNLSIGALDVAAGGDYTAMDMFKRFQGSVNTYWRTSGDKRISPKLAVRLSPARDNIKGLIDAMNPKRENRQPTEEEVLAIKQSIEQLSNGNQDDAIVLGKYADREWNNIKLPADLQLIEDETSNDGKALQLALIMNSMTPEQQEQYARRLHEHGLELSEDVVNKTYKYMDEMSAMPVKQK